MGVAALTEPHALSQRALSLACLETAIRDRVLSVRCVEKAGSTSLVDWLLQWRCALFSGSWKVVLTIGVIRA